MTARGTCLILDVICMRCPVKGWLGPPPSFSTFSFQFLLQMKKQKSRPMTQHTNDNEIVPFYSVWQAKRIATSTGTVEGGVPLVPRHTLCFSV